MKTIVKRLVRDEKGAAFVVALILLLIGGLVSAALLGYMGSGLLVGEVYETRTAELYAADAGVEDAMWKIEHRDESGLPDCGNAWDYTYPGLYDPPFEVNGKSVVVTIHHVGAGIFKITSSAVTIDGGDTAAIDSATTVEAYVSASFMDFSGILDNVITTINQIGPPSEDKKNIHIMAEGHEPVENYPEDQWPSASQLISFYQQQVENVAPYGSNEIILTGDWSSPGPIYNDMEEPMTITSSVAGASLTMNDIAYITGDILLGQTGSYMKLNLNGNTLFVQSDTTGGGYALRLGGNCEVEGPGVIVAIGDIELAPSYSIGSEDGPVFVMSVLGSTILHPGADYGEFYGSIAGNVTVVVQAGKEVKIKYPELEGWYEGLNFPLGDIQFQDLICNIDSWEVNQQ
jgi:Flp pilus assembly pilin Flp